MIFAMEAVKHVYEVRPRKDHRGIGLISDVLPFGRLWYGDPNVSRAVTPREVTAPSLAKAMGRCVRWTLGLATPQLRSLHTERGISCLDGRRLIFMQGLA